MSLSVKKITVALAGAVLACLAVAPSAGAAEVSPRAADTFYKCGFVPSYSSANGNALYNHCGETRVKIIVENIWFQDTEKCVYPGVTDIEGASRGSKTRDAWYIGNC